MLDPETIKQIDEILNTGNIEQSTDITPSPEVLAKIKEGLRNIPTPALCIMYTFISGELGDRNIEIEND